MSNKFISLEDLSIDNEIAQEVFNIQKEDALNLNLNKHISIDLYNSENNSWVIGFARTITKLSDINIRKKDFQTALKFNRESIKVLEYISNHFRHNFEENNSIHSNVHTLEKYCRQNKFLYWILDSKSIKKLIKDFVNGDIFDSNQITNFDGSVIEVASNQIYYLTLLMNYDILDILQSKRKDIVALMKSNDFYNKDFVDRTSSRNSDTVDSVELIGIFSKLLVKNNEFRDSVIFSGLRKNLLKFARKIRGEVFEDYASLDFRNYKFNYKLELLIELKFLDYKLMKRKNGELYNLKINEPENYYIELNSLKDSGINYNHFRLHYHLEKCVYIYYQILFHSSQSYNFQILEEHSKHQKIFRSEMKKVENKYSIEEIRALSRNINLNSGLVNEAVGMMCDNTEEGIAYLSRAIGIFKSIRSKKAGITIALVNYKSLINLCEIDSSIDDIQQQSERRLNSLEILEDKTIEDYPPIFRHVYNTLEIVSKISKNDDESLKYLFSKIASSASSSSLVNSRKKMAKLVLTYNLLEHEIDEKNRAQISTSLKKYILDGKINFNQDNILSPDQALIDDLNREESNDLEFKGSWGLNIKDYYYTDFKDKKYLKDEDVKKSVLKNIAAMQNTNGGKIYIGILENDDTSLTEDLKSWMKENNAHKVNNKIVFGVSYELDQIKNNLDSYTRDIETSIMNKLSQKSLENIKFKDYHDVLGTDAIVICIEVYPIFFSGVIFLGDKFYWRTSKSAKAIPLIDVRSYLDSRDRAQEEKLDKFD